MTTEPIKEHWRGDGCPTWHGKMPDPIPLRYIRAQFQESLMIRDIGHAPDDYGATRYPPTKEALDAKIWLQHNAYQIIATLLGYIKEEA